MVQEYRRIMLEEDELCSALGAYRRMRPMGLPPGKIIRCVPSQAGAGAATVTVTIEPPHDKPGPVTQHILTEATMLEPLIRFCIENNIVLPRDGRKSVAVAGERISLCVTLDLSLGLCQQHEAPTAVKFHSVPRETILKSVGAR